MGIDISSQAIEFAEKRLKETHLKNMIFDVSSSSSITFPAKSFDIVTSTLVCHHLKDDQLIDFLKRSYQIAKKSVIINDLHRHWLAYSGFALIARPFFLIVSFSMMVYYPSNALLKNRIGSII